MSEGGEIRDVPIAAPTADSLCVKIIKEDSSVPPKLICPHWGSA